MGLGCCLDCDCDCDFCFDFVFGLLLVFVESFAAGVMISTTDLAQHTLEKVVYFLLCILFQNLQDA